MTTLWAVIFTPLLALSFCTALYLAWIFARHRKVWLRLFAVAPLGVAWFIASVIFNIWR